MFWEFTKSLRKILNWETVKLREASKRKLTPKLQSSIYIRQMLTYLLTYLAANYTQLQALAIVIMSQQIIIINY